MTTPSSSPPAIPGNEKAIGHVMNHLARRGTDVIYEGIKHVHVSGHGSEEELKLVLSLVRPRHFIPIHGENTGSCRTCPHRRARDGRHPPAVKVMLIENGDILRFDENGGAVVGKAPTGRVLIDASGSGEVIDEVLRDRRHLAEDGGGAGCRDQQPDRLRRRRPGRREPRPGAGCGQPDLLRDAAKLVADVIQGASIEERTDQGLIKEKIRVELRRFFRKRSGGGRSSSRSSWRSSVAGSTLSRRLSEFFGVALFAPALIW